MIQLKRFYKNLPRCYAQQNLDSSLSLGIMKYSSLKEERKLWREGKKRVVCLDEAGRGPLAGPVVACAALILPQFKIESKELRFLKDSKKLTPQKRERIYKILKKLPQVEFAVSQVSEKVIDKINILEATKVAMVKAVKKLKRKPDFLILDGNFTLPADFVARRRLRRPKAEAFLPAQALAKAGAKAGIKTEIPQKSIIKADEKIFSCKAASIIAKVYRDRIMEKYHKKYPSYGFAKHKGYGTRYHFRMLKKYGPCKIHRKTFWPVKKD